MNYYFLPTSRNVLPTYQTFCPVGVQIAQTVVHLPFFKFRSGKGLFWGGVVDVLCKYISPKGVCDSCVRNRVGCGILGKMRPHLGKMRHIWAICNFAWKMGKSSLESGKENSISLNWLTQLLSCLVSVKGHRMQDCNTVLAYQTLLR